MTSRRAFLTATALGLSALASQPAFATETINLTVLSGYNDRASWVRVFKEFWMPEVNRRLAETGNYTLNYTEAFGTVVRPRGELEATATGIADIGLVVSVFHADRLPLASVSFVTPFVTTDLELNARTYDELTYRFPEMLGAWNDLGMEFLGHMGTIPTYAVLSSEPIESIEDFDGLKFAGAGLNLRWIEGLGATGVPSALTRFYSDTQSGVSDGMISWAETITGFNLCEVAPYYIDAGMGAVTSFAVAANSGTWSRLPEEVQNVMREVTPLYRDELARVTTEAAAAGLEACVEQGGTIVEFTAEQREEWAAALPNIAQEWAADADEQGLPGTDVLNAYMEIMRENDQPILRDWDREGTTN
ncbi:MAG: C4-dicarboxylate TRAP transporter substrate-binding protein [Pseudomonadota bacterium]